MPAGPQPDTPERPETPPPAQGEVDHEAILIQIADRVGAGVDFADLHAEITEQHAAAHRPVEGEDADSEWRFEFSGMSILANNNTHVVEVKLSPGRTLPRFFAHLQLAEVTAKEGFEHDGRGPTGEYYFYEVVKNIYLHLDLPKPGAKPTFETATLPIERLEIVLNE